MPAGVVRVGRLVAVGPLGLGQLLASIPARVGVETGPYASGSSLTQEIACLTLGQASLLADTLTALAVRQFVRPRLTLPRRSKTRHVVERPLPFSQTRLGRLAVQRPILDVTRRTGPGSGLPRVRP